MKPISTTDYLTAAGRPLYTVLDGSWIARVHGIERPPLRSALAEMVRAMLAQASAEVSW